MCLLALWNIGTQLYDLITVISGDDGVSGVLLHHKWVPNRLLSNNDINLMNSFALCCSSAWWQAGVCCRTAKDNPPVTFYIAACETQNVSVTVLPVFGLSGENHVSAKEMWDTMSKVNRWYLFLPMLQCGYGWFFIPFISWFVLIFTLVTYYISVWS